MGINGFWDVLGEGEVRNIADFAADFFAKHKRPLRIAVDEACWRFTNLSDEQRDKIRQDEPAANPQEKVSLWRILRLWRLNIQLIFVWDGPCKPGKARSKGRGGGLVDDQVIKMLHLMFNQLSVPYHQAPGEAEAECARLQQLGIVDAVWSDDGDSFMFGCGTLIKAHKVNGKRVDDSVRIYQASEIFQKHGLDAEGFTLFALLAGGDYDTVGLRKRGPQTAKLLARKDYGLASSLKHVEKRELPAWRQSLADLSRVLGKAVDVPPEFPKWKALEGYRNPKVSDDDQCRNVRALRNDGWNKRIDQVPLRAFLRDYYNFQTREYVKHLGPVFLASALSDVMSPERQRENMVFGVRLKSGRQRKDLSDGKPNPEVKIVFKPRELMEIDLDNAPAEEDWVTPVNASGATHGPPLEAECEMLECFLRHGLPEGSWDPVSKSKKVKSQAGDETPAAAQNNGEVAAVEQTSEASASKKRRRTSEKAPEGEAEKRQALRNGQSLQNKMTRVRLRTLSLVARHQRKPQNQPQERRKARAKWMMAIHTLRLLAFEPLIYQSR